MADEPEQEPSADLQFVEIAEIAEFNMPKDFGSLESVPGLRSLTGTWTGTWWADDRIVCKLCGLRFRAEGSFSAYAERDGISLPICDACAVQHGVPVNDSE